MRVLLSAALLWSAFAQYEGYGAYEYELDAYAEACEEARDTCYAGDADLVALVDSCLVDENMDDCFGEEVRAWNTCVEDEGGWLCGYGEWHWCVEAEYRCLDELTGSEYDAYVLYYYFEGCHYFGYEADCDYEGVEELEQCVNDDANCAAELAHYQLEYPQDYGSDYDYGDDWMAELHEQCHLAQSPLECFYVFAETCGWHTDGTCKSFDLNQITCDTVDIESCILAGPCTVDYDNNTCIDWDGWTESDDDYYGDYWPHSDCYLDHGWREGESADERCTAMEGCCYHASANYCHECEGDWDYDAWKAEEDEYMRQIEEHCTTVEAECLGGDAALEQKLSACHDSEELDACFSDDVQAYITCTQEEHWFCGPDRWHFCLAAEQACIDELTDTPEAAAELYDDSLQCHYYYNYDTCDDEGVEELLDCTYADEKCVAEIEWLDEYYYGYDYYWYNEHEHCHEAEDDIDCFYVFGEDCGWSGTECLSFDRDEITCPELLMEDCYFAEPCAVDWEEETCVDYADYYDYSACEMAELDCLESGNYDDVYYAILDCFDYFAADPWAACEDVDYSAVEECMERDPECAAEMADIDSVDSSESSDSSDEINYDPDAYNELMPRAWDVTSEAPAGVDEVAVDVVDGDMSEVQTALFYLNADNCWAGEAADYNEEYLVLVDACTTIKYMKNGAVDSQFSIGLTCDGDAGDVMYTTYKKDQCKNSKITNQRTYSESACYECPADAPCEHAWNTCWKCPGEECPEYCGEAQQMVYVRFSANSGAGSYCRNDCGVAERVKFSEGKAQEVYENVMSSCECEDMCEAAEDKKDLGFVFDGTKNKCLCAKFKDKYERVPSDNGRYRSTAAEA